jgi:anhydro-N-acetylmuramic acid kinase
MLLNTLAKKLGCEYDDGGKFARTGKIQKDLLEQMNALSFYRQKGARSLGREWMDAEMLPLLISSNSTTEDFLCTACEHIAEKISESINGAGIQNVLVSGGGAYNEFLLERIRSKTLAKLIIPEDSIIQFKEALIFAFLGFLRLNDQVNTLASVTGASKDSCGGSVYRSH